MIDMYTPPEKTTGIDLIVFANTYESLFRRNYNISPNKATREQLVRFAQEVEELFKSHQQSRRQQTSRRT